MRYICALLVLLQHAFPSVVVAVAAPASVLLAACSTPDQRQQGRQDTRIEQRTEDRYDRRRGE